MSAAGATVAGVAPQQYFCYQCNRTVTINTSPNDDLLCPTCNGGFVEEYENPNPNPNPHTNLDLFSAFSDPLSGFLGSLPFLLSSGSTTGDLQNPPNLSNILGPSSRTSQTRSHAQEPDPFDPFIFLQNYLGNIRAGGANIQFVIDNHPSDQGFRLPANFGDYFVGPGLEQLIQQLAENDPNRYGTPPAAKSAIRALPSITVDLQLLSSDLAQCAVCKDDFEPGMEVKQMPCKHVYHSDCILPWLELHNSCPVCRYELPTDDPDYDNGTQGTIGSGNLRAGSSSSGEAFQEGSPGQRTRRFRISLPWPFGAFGPSMETSDGQVGNNSNRDGGGESNSGGQQNRE